MAKNNFVAQLPLIWKWKKNISCICISKVSCKTSGISFWWINCPER